MPKATRINSKTEIYHVMLRGINHQQIFEDDEDNKKFLDVLKDCKKLSGFELHKTRKTSLCLFYLLR